MFSKSSCAIRVTSAGYLLSLLAPSSDGVPSLLFSAHLKCDALSFKFLLQSPAAQAIVQRGQIRGLKGSVPRVIELGVVDRESTYRKYRSTKEEMDPISEALELGVKEVAHFPYEVTNSKLGETGTTASAIYPCKDKYSGELKACKYYDTNKILNRGDILLEVRALVALDHPNIVKLFGVWANQGDIILVMEHLSGGDLFTNISNIDIKSENKSAVWSSDDSKDITNSIVSALAYMHSIGIAHRDVSLENIVFDRHRENEKNGPLVKLVDFGFAGKRNQDQETNQSITINQENSNMHQSMQYTGKSRKELSDHQSMQYTGFTKYVGKRFYKAPEVQGEKKRSEYGFNVDGYSAAVATYFMLRTDKYAYYDKQPDEDDVLINDSDVDKDATDFLKGATNFDKKTRLSTASMLKHAWLSNSQSRKSVRVLSESEKELIHKAVRGLALAASEEPIGVIVAYIAAQNRIITKTENNDIYEVFKSLDLDFDGRIQLDELEKNTPTQNIPKLKPLFDAVDIDKSGYLETTEVLLLLIPMMNMKLTNDRWAVQPGTCSLQGNKVDDEEYRISFGFQENEVRRAFELLTKPTLITILAPHMSERDLFLMSTRSDFPNHVKNASKSYAFGFAQV